MTNGPMSNIDKQALREAAEKALNARARLALMESVFDDDGDDVKPEAQEDISICVSFNELTNPATVLALLDELEAMKRANAAQDDHINQQQNRIDQLEKGHSEAAKQINSWRKLAKQNIAEREKDLSELDIARKRVAELEAREVKIPSLKQTESGERYVWSDGVYNFMQDVTDAIRAAGIRINGEG